LVPVHIRQAEPHGIRSSIAADIELNSYIIPDRKISQIERRKIFMQLHKSSGRTEVVIELDRLSVVAGNQYGRVIDGPVGVLSRISNQGILIVQNQRIPGP